MAVDSSHVTRHLSLPLGDVVMNCKEFRENLTLEIYGELPLEQRAAFEAHLAGCANCQAARDEMRGLHRIRATALS